MIIIMIIITTTSESTNVKVQYSRINIVNSAICTMNSNYRTAATLYTTQQPCLVFYVLRESFEITCLNAGTVKFNTQDEE